MKFNITTRHFDGLTDSLKSDIEMRMSKLEKFIDRIVEAKVTLSEEKNRQIVEISIHLPGGIRLLAKEQANDMWAAVELAIKKIEVQVKKVNERKKEKKRDTLRKGE
jgi:putative sigma-54 modulation protein